MHVIRSSTLFTTASGSKCSAMTAFGITYTDSGSILALSTVFSFDVCDTQITASISESVKTSSLLVRIEAVSLNPNKEWSVKQLVDVLLLSNKEMNTFLSLATERGKWIHDRVERMPSNN